MPDTPRRDRVSQGLFRSAGVVLGLATGPLGKMAVRRTDVRSGERAVKDCGTFLENVQSERDAVGLLRRVTRDEKRHIAAWRSCIGILSGEPRN